MHPTGMSIQGSTLYILSQGKMQLLSFDLTKQVYNDKVIDPLPDKPEAVVVIKC